MRREIFEVYAKVVDANGAYNTLSGYPKVFDSRSYEGDIEKTRRRAEGEFSETWGAMCKRDDRQVQTVMLLTSDGVLLESKRYGVIAEDEDPR